MNLHNTVKVSAVKTIYTIYISQKRISCQEEVKIDLVLPPQSKPTVDGEGMQVLPYG